MSFLNPFKTEPVVPSGPPPLVPTFLPASVILLGNPEAPNSPTPANSLYWASQTTAQELALRFNAKAVEKPAFFQYKWERVSFSPATQEYLQFGPDGPQAKFLNAGEIAGYFQRNPEDKFPGLAVMMARRIIDAEISSS